MRVGIAVYCNVCGRQKQPLGRSIPLGMSMCDDECRGYSQEPLPGSLWPGESQEQFGYPVGPNATEEQ